MTIPLSSSVASDEATVHSGNVLAVDLTRRVEVAADIDGRCDAFEQALVAGQEPRLADYLCECPAELQPRLLRELLLLLWDFHAARSDDRGFEIAIDALPQHAEAIASLHADWRAERRRRQSPPPQGMSAAPASGDASSLSPPTIAVADLLGITAPVADLSDEVRGDILQASASRRFARGERLLAQGEPGTEILIVVEGAVEIRLEESGQRHVIARVGPATVLGEMSVLTGQPCTASAVALGDGAVLALPAEEFRRLAQKHSSLLPAFSRLMSDRLGRAPLDALSGKQVGEYTIARCVGYGGMGVVYEAHNERGERRALKMMSHRLAYNEEAMRRFHEEVRLGQSIEHPQVVKVYESFAAFGSHAMALEFCDGHTLATLVRKKSPLPLAAVKAILGQLAQALHYLHSEGIVHRDIKPANVMLLADGAVKLMDFGLARRADRDDITASGHLVGTLRYMAPEQLLGKPADARSDLYAFGCLAYELIAGKPLFDQGDVLAHVWRRTQWALPEREEIRDDLDEDLHALLGQCLAGDPNDRRLDLRSVMRWATKVEGLNAW